MGRKTWDSLPTKFKPLPNRLNVILTKGTTASITGGVSDENGMIEVYGDFEQSLLSLSANPRVNEIYVIGGAAIYELALKQYSDYCKMIILTRISKPFEADTFMPKIFTDDECTSCEGAAFTKLHIS